MSMLNVNARKEGTQGVFTSEDTRYKIIGRLPVQEVEAHYMTGYREFQT